MIRPAPLALGLAVCGAAWLTPWAALGLGPFSAHMLRHVALVALAPALIALGAPSLGRMARVSPLIAAAAEFVVVWSWHLPALHDAARLAAPVFALEQGSFLAVGLLVWAAALRPGGALAGAGALLMTSMHMTLLGAVVTLSPQILYAYCASLADQRIGGMLMLAVGGPVYLGAGLLLVARVLQRGGDPA